MNLKLCIPTGAFPDGWTTNTIVFCCFGRSLTDFMLFNKIHSSGRSDVISKSRVSIDGLVKRNTKLAMAPASISVGAVSKSLSGADEDFPGELSLLLSPLSLSFFFSISE